MEWLSLSPEEWNAVRLSLKVATVAMIASLPVAIAVGHGAGASELLGQVAAQWPGALAAGAAAGGDRLCLAADLRQAWSGWQFPAETFGLVFSFRWTGAALACAVMGFPLMVRAIRLSIEAVDRKLEDAAATMGASPLWVFATVTLPLILPGIIAGMILCFAKAMGEFGATITFVSNIPGETQTLPSAIYTYTQVPGGDANALRLTAVSVVISLGALIVSEILARRVGSRVAE